VSACFETAAAAVKGAYCRLCATGYCYRGIVVVVDDAEGGGGALPAFPGRFSHHRGI